jgi:hypothetical protein
MSFLQSPNEYLVEDVYNVYAGHFKYKKLVYL